MLAGVGALALPNLLSSCSSYSKLPDGNFEGKVIIIGAGAAGLYAGHLLAQKGIDFTILEASEKFGGRLARHSGFADFDIDTGAQWLHGQRSIIADLVWSTKTPVFEDESEEIFWYNNQLKTYVPKNIEQAIKSLERATKDISASDYYRENGGTDDGYHLLCAVSGEAGADPTQISALREIMGYDEYSAGNKDFKFENTYYDLFEKHIYPSVQSQIQLNTAVQSIDYSSPTVIITDTNGKKYQADKVIVAVPLTILQQGDITFSPELPAGKTKAFHQLGMTAGIKAYLKFSEGFFDENIFGGEICASYVNESYNRSTNDHILFGFIMGEKAETFSQMNEKDALNALLAELDRMYDGKASASYIDHYFKDWSKEPFVRGAYSFPKVESHPKVRTIIAEPVENRLFFAGEATNHNGHHATVHGAAETGLREIKRILSNL